MSNWMTIGQKIGADVAAAQTDKMRAVGGQPQAPISGGMGQVSQSYAPAPGAQAANLFGGGKASEAAPSWNSAPSFGGNQPASVGSTWNSSPLQVEPANAKFYGR